MLIEMNPPGIPYGEPRDLTMDEGVELLTSTEHVWQWLSAGWRDTLVVVVRLRHASGTPRPQDK